MGQNYEVSVNSFATMLDGKAVNALSGNFATSRCPVCRKTYKDFKDDEPQFQLPDDDNHTMFLISLGISLLHA